MKNLKTSVMKATKKAPSADELKGLVDYLREEEAMKYSSYLEPESQLIITTVYIFDIPIKQVKINLEDTNYQLIEKEGTDAETEN